MERIIGATKTECHALQNRDTTLKLTLTLLNIYVGLVTNYSRFNM
jgi:hypothetical protein